MHNPPSHLRSILWEYNIEDMDISHPMVSERVLLLGDAQDIAYVGLEQLGQYFIQKHPSLDNRSHNFWEIIFSIEKTPPLPSLYEQINHPTSRRNFG